MKSLPKAQENEVVNNVLPGELGGETAWFYKMNKFQQQETVRQVKFKLNHWPEFPNGQFTKYPNRFYPHILPAGSSLELALYKGFADEAISYFNDENIEIHSEFLNLKSSQAACVNFLFPLRQNLSLATNVFNDLLGDVMRVTAIEFEYTGPEGSTEWLGEPSSGKRGQYRTSIDAAVFWEDTNEQSHCTLIEWKYTEAGYGSCSAYSDGSLEEKSACKNLVIQKSLRHAGSCLLTKGGDKRSRHYWMLLDEAGISTESLSKVQGCPFRSSFYQLMRQHLLAHYLRKKLVADIIDVLSMGFGGNRSLGSIPYSILPLREDRREKILDVWNKILVNVPSMRHVDVTHLAEKLDNCSNVNPEWRTYLKERYGV